MSSKEGSDRKIGSEAKEKIIGGFNPLAIRLTQPISADEMRRGESAFFEKCHPKKVLVITQAATTALQIRLLHVNAVAKLRVSHGLVLHPKFDIFPFVAPHAVGSKRLPEAPGQFLIPGEVPRFQHGGFR